jgi:hypothetical protein
LHLLLNFNSICPKHHACLFKCKFTTYSKFSWEELPNFLCHHPGKTAMLCLQLLGAPGDRMDLEIRHNQKKFYSKVLSQNNAIFSRSLIFPIPNYVTALRENSWRLRQGRQQRRKTDCVLYRLTKSLGMTLPKEVCKRQQGVKYSLYVNIKQNI